MTRNRGFVDAWDDDDPALTRLREALALQPTQEPSGRPDAPTSVPDATTRRDRIAAAARRFEAGDMSAVATLRELLLDK